MACGRQVILNSVRQARLELDVAVVAAHEPARDVEAQAGCLTDGFGGEERIENLLADSGGTPGPLSTMWTITQSARRLALRYRSVPARPTASIALSMRFVHTWFSSLPMARTLGRSGCRATLDVTDFLRPLCSSSGATVSLMPTRTGPRLLEPEPDP